MPIILNIDTATELASVCLSDNEKILAIEENAVQNDHASFLQSAIKKVCEKSNLPLNSIHAIAVSAGPGSYTGLRVGLSSAKGLCYALNKPLILIDTLYLIATNSVKYSRSHQLNLNNSSVLFCPLIDARRMEVYTALYDASLNTIFPSQAVILTENFLADYLQTHKVIVSGSGSNKLNSLINHPNIVYSPSVHTASDMIGIASKYYELKKFADLAYSEPFYLKSFHEKSTSQLKNIS